MHTTLRCSMLFVLSFALFTLVACSGGSGSGSDPGGPAGSGGSASGGSGGFASGNPGGGGTGGGTAGQGGAGGDAGASACSPAASNSWNCTGASSCTCNSTKYTDQAWCDNWSSKGIELCPSGANVCTPGHNQCSYDLPVGQDYEPAQCMDYVTGDTWVDEQSNPGYVQTSMDANGLIRLSFGNLTGGGPYYHGFILSGSKVYWDRTNVGTAESGDGQFSADCQTVDVNIYEAGQTTPSSHSHLAWLRHGS